MYKVYREWHGRKRLVYSTDKFSDAKWYLFGLISQYKRIGTINQVTNDDCYLNATVNGGKVEYYVRM